MAAAQAINSKAGVDIGVSIGEEGQREFFLAVGDYYRVPQREVMIIKERGIPSHEVPVVLFLAKRAHVEPEVIMDLRLSGYTWLDITLRSGLNPKIFYVPIGLMVTGPPYGKAYGYYKKKPKKEWKTIPMSDDDVINLVNLKFLSEHYGYPPEKIIMMRSGGKEFVEINDEIKGEKEKIKEQEGSFFTDGVWKLALPIQRWKNLLRFSEENTCNFVNWKLCFQYAK